MKTTFKVSYYLRSNYENKEGKSPVMLRMYLGGEMANLGSTKIFVDKSKWSNKTSRMIGRTAEALSVNASIDALTTTLMENPLETGPVDLRKVVHPSYCTSDMLKCSSFFL
jgi:hypothetical protein